MRLEVKHTTNKAKARQVRYVAIFATWLALLGTSAFTVHAAEGQRYTNAVTPLLDAAGGKAVGSLQPGVAVDVTGESGTATHVVVHGWSARGSENIIVAAADRHIVLVTEFSGHGTPGSTQTVNGTPYQAVTLDGWVATSALVDDVQTVWKSAETLFGEKCATCHALPSISFLTANQWPVIMKTQASNAALEPGETALLTAYLQANTTKQ
jgi:hypothetical protein